MLSVLRRTTNMVYPRYSTRIRAVAPENSGHGAGSLPVSHHTSLVYHERLFECPARAPKEKRNMLGWAVTFLVVALIAAVLGFTGIAGAATWVAQVLFVLFLILFVVSLFVRGR
jgi:uncharacterized membrane protein YtjA (UPF0391 family)